MEHIRLTGEAGARRFPPHLETLLSGGAASTSSRDAPRYSRGDPVAGWKSNFPLPSW